VTAQSARGARRVAADDFFQSYFTTALADDELLTAIEVPAAGPSAWAFYELTRRRGDFAIAGVAATFSLDAGRLVRSGRVVLFAVDEKPIRATDAEAALVGRRLDDDAAIADASALAAQAAAPTGDIHGSARHRQRMTEVVVRRALSSAHYERENP
jgi:aerobic carbon-monoxide dehydrogenase medium subunit